jgi:uncharacterized protein YukJ
MTHRRTKPAGAVRRYGVLVGRIRDGKESESGQGKSPHYEIWVTAGDADFRIAVNVRSVDGSDVLAFYDPAYQAPDGLDLAELAASAGYRPIATGPGGEGHGSGGLDYLRQNLFARDRMSQIPPDGAGITLSNLLDGQVERAKADQQAVVIAFGESFQDQGADQYFGFSPERGVHDIHMMQGNSGNFANDNRVYGDGALFIRFQGGETVALFTRFTVQATTTDDATGAPR